MAVGTLLLNGDWTPLRVISLKRAIVLVIQGKAEILKETDLQFRSATTSMNIPDVIRLKYFVKIPYRAKIPLSRKNLLARDHHTCQYCGKGGDTIDHVVPKSRGGKHTWTNVVIACRRCNFNKGDKLLSEIGWTLAKKPEVPMGTKWLILGLKDASPAWDEFLGVPV